MTTTATAHQPTTFSGAAAYTAGMTNLDIAGLTAATLRSSSATPNYDATHERVNAVARLIAEDALAKTGGRRTYSWEGNGIRLAYAGDTVDDQGDFAFGPTTREYLVNGTYKTTAPVPSQSGTGLLNLSLDHVRDCSDPIVDAKRQITWLLLDPSLDLVEYVIRTSTSWHGLLQMPHKLRTALSIRLAEIVEQKVLENPDGGLDLNDLLEGTNVVGYMVKTLDGSIFNLMKRIEANESKQRTVLDTPIEDDDAYRRPIVELATEQLPQSAEHDHITGADDARAIAALEAMHEEAAAIADARERQEKVRSRRNQEKAAIVARTFLAQTGLPAPILPTPAVREQLVKELAAEEAEYRGLVQKAEEDAAAESARTGEKQPVAPVIREVGVAYRSFLAWHNLLHGTSDESDGEVSDEWLSIWESYTPEDTSSMMGYVAGHPERVTKVAAGLLPMPEKMSAAAKMRVRDAMKHLADNQKLNELTAAAVNKYDLMRRGEDAGGWAAAAAAVVAHPASKVHTAAELVEAFDDALYSLGLS